MFTSIRMYNAKTIRRLQFPGQHQVGPSREGARAHTCADSLSGNCPRQHADNIVRGEMVYLAVPTVQCVFLPTGKSDYDQDMYCTQC